MFISVLLLLLSTVFVIPQGYSLVCYMCDTIGQSNCLGSTCVGTACLKRFAVISGLIRVQKMCQQTNEPLLEYCDTNVLWKEGTGIECVCQTDYCNNSGKPEWTIIFTFILFLIFYIL